jgi:hypothetical protein
MGAVIATDTTHAGAWPVRAVEEEPEQLIRLCEPHN